MQECGLAESVRHKTHSLRTVTKWIPHQQYYLEPDKPITHLLRLGFHHSTLSCPQLLLDLLLIEKGSVVCLQFINCRYELLFSVSQANWIAFPTNKTAMNYTQLAGTQQLILCSFYISSLIVIELDMAVPARRI